MLPKRSRLKINRAQQFKWRDKKQIYTPLFKLVFHYSRNSPKPRIGFIVPGRIKGAVKRNRIRRLLTEAVKERINKFPPDIEAILIANTEVEKATYEDVITWINKIISKIHIPNE
ncbi:MAG: ribonuclease P protein component [Candidatus Woykebacteria bacterium]